MKDTNTLAYLSGVSVTKRKMFYEIVTRLLARAMALNGSFSAMYSAALTPMALQIKVDSVKIVFLVREMSYPLRPKTPLWVGSILTKKYYTNQVQMV